MKLLALKKPLFLALILLCSYRQPAYAVEQKRTFFSYENALNVTHGLSYIAIASWFLYAIWTGHTEHLQKLQENNARRAGQFISGLHIG